MQTTRKSLILAAAMALVLALSGCGSPASPQISPAVPAVTAGVEPPAQPLNTPSIETSPVTAPPAQTSSPAPDLEMAYATATAAMGSGVIAGEVISGTFKSSEQGIFLASEQKLPEVSLADLAAEMTFDSPGSAPETGWTYGIIWRFANNSGHIVHVNSDRTWQHFLVLDGHIQTVEEGSLPPAGTIQAVTLRLVSTGSQGQLWVNGEFVAQLDLSGWVEPGSLYPAIGDASSEQVKAGAAVIVKDYRVWSLEGGR